MNTTDDADEPETGFDATPLPRAGEKSPESDNIAPTGIPLIPDDEAGGFSPWVWGSVLILVALVAVWFFSR